MRKRTQKPFNYIRTHTLSLSLSLSQRSFDQTYINILGPFQTSLFSSAEPNINEQNHLFELICIRFGAGEVWRLN